jgi:hypothetical protein
MPLSKEEIEELKDQFRDELITEHNERELRAERKSERRQNRFHPRNHTIKKEEDLIKAEVRASFYEEYGYEEKIDPTGRRLYLSPNEIKNKQRKKRGKKNRKSKVAQKTIHKWYAYLLIAVMGVITAIALVKSI